MRVRSSFWFAFVGLAATNIVSIIFLLFGWVDIPELLWSYWLQSVFIGVYNAIRMMSVDRFSTEGFTSNGQRVPETPEGKRSTVLFFLAHYGFFHLGYMVFLAHFTFQNPFPLHRIIWILALSLGFALSDLFSLREQIRIDRQGIPNLGALMFRPYLRIVPMHLCILAGGMTGFAVLVFLGLKTLADLLGHYVDDRINRNAETRASQKSSPEQSAAGNAETADSGTADQVR